MPSKREWHPLHYSCLENPRDGGAWEATVQRSTTMVYVNPTMQLLKGKALKTAGTVTQTQTCKYDNYRCRWIRTSEGKWSGWLEWSQFILNIKLQ